MKRKLIFGIILVLILFLLMPSIPAIENNFFKEKIFNDSQVEYSVGNVKEFEENVKNGFWKHPIANLLIIISFFRLVRGLTLMCQASNWDFLNYEEELIIYDYLLFVRGIWLCSTGAFFNIIVGTFMDIMGWDFMYD